ncbi:isoleucine--tRNA ligase [Kiloniella laminariae]|uniref:Isoleucine--tRNA ligase n=1 Tax=Kiloniella laminariae TaxID=454162 RepID=A0ABT4LKV0_9PROT|nr:isoleucine--tRNA ligase [Kiloniella laminariae]MCZ4281739.1 isoleucine--tRNA ligase [Kiloniella laminariae]
MSTDYKDTVFLPKTDFPMRAGLPAKEPEILKHWIDIGLFEKLRATSKDREKFVLHDGPPYANGHLHMGHALNKVLKDVINRSQQMMGKNAHYVPGWDCHGLPIEWKIEEGYRARGQDKDEVPVIEFRKECREFADKWIATQIDEFKRLGIEADWDKPYKTMDFASEALIVKEMGKFLMNKGLYMGTKAVLWSVVEKTALADAEVEYHEHKSPTIWVRFPIASSKDPLLEGASIVIWTTTPWTIPANRAVACGAEFEYVVYEVEALGEGSLAKVGERLVLNRELSEQVRLDARIEKWREVGVVSDLTEVRAQHPLRGLEGADGGYDYEVPLLQADFVTNEAGTGFVHIAPSHGADDNELGRKHGLEVPMMLDEAGIYYDHVPFFAGACVYTQEGKPGDANGKAIKALIDTGGLLAKGSMRHSYPHSWRSKAPLIFRSTPQWFISMETNDLRKKALKAIDDTRFVPEQGSNRLYKMVEGRPDWCVSRQRVWGVPLPIFMEKKTGEPLRDQKVLDRIVAAFHAEGGDAWFNSAPERFLGNEYKADDFEQIMDVIEVWFDSGSTHSFVLEARPELKWPADLYLEGSDQHRGWFHTSLLESAGTRNRAPYDAVLTHGFVLDDKGRKMSKSLGNIIAPAEIIAKYGADILRLWVVASDYSQDLRVGDEILKYQADAYRRLRNTLRFLLGSLDGFSDEERLPAEEMPELEKWVLHRLTELDVIVRKSCDDYDYHAMFQALHNFCAVDLSAFYLDLRKDALYCDASDSTVRRAARTVIDILFDSLTAWLAPILCFTTEEAWLARGKKGAEESVHLRTFAEIPASWKNEELASRWDKIREVRRVVTGAIEVLRAEKKIGSSLQARPAVYVSRNELMEAIGDLDMADICITSQIELVSADAPEEAYRIQDVEGVGVVVDIAEGDKCQRCWKVLPDVGSHPQAEDTCSRCADVLVKS